MGMISDFLTLAYGYLRNSHLSYIHFVCGCPILLHFSTEKAQEEEKSAAD